MALLFRIRGSSGQKSAFTLCQSLLGVKILFLVVSALCLSVGGGFNLTCVPFHALNRSSLVTELICEFKMPWSLVGRSRGTGLNKLPHCSSAIISLNEN